MNSSRRFRASPRSWRSIRRGAVRFAAPDRDPRRGGLSRVRVRSPAHPANRPGNQLHHVTRASEDDLRLANSPALKSIPESELRHSCDRPANGLLRQPLDCDRVGSRLRAGRFQSWDLGERLGGSPIQLRKKLRLARGAASLATRMTQGSTRAGAPSLGPVRSGGRSSTGRRRLLLGRIAASGRGVAGGRSRSRRGGVRGGRGGGWRSRGRCGVGGRRSCGVGRGGGVLGLVAGCQAKRRQSHDAGRENRFAHLDPFSQCDSEATRSQARPASERIAPHRAPDPAWGPPRAA